MNNLTGKYQKELMYLIVVCSLIYGFAYFGAISEYDKDKNSIFLVIHKISKFIVTNSNKCNLKEDDVIGINFQINSLRLIAILKSFS